jgi:chemotaxis protein histidine kinase CheA
LAAALGGEIELQTQAGKGSRFELVLPANRRV